jgi:hypothetical protein
MHTYTGDLLLKYHHSSTEWETNDSAELYHYNLAHQPSDWYYRDHTVEYEWNSNGYRCAEWSDIAWSTSHVLMGCSYAMGHGVSESDSITGPIANAVNLAQSGTSISAIQYNTIRLIQAGIRPASVSIIVPNMARLTYWGTDSWLDLTPHDLRTRGEHLVPHVRDCYKGWLAIDPNAEQHGYMTAVSVQALWLSVDVQCGLYQHWAPENASFNLGTQLPQQLDNARDVNSTGFAHPGRVTLALWRDVIYGQ